jgi:DnaK suppressor protein
MMIHTEHYKEILLAEKRKIEAELSTLGRINPSDTTDWEPVAESTDEETAEVEERATEITSFEDRSALEFEIEDRLRAVRDAIARIEDGTYGNCSVCQSPIDDARLTLVPEATTCRLHMN